MGYYSIVIVIISVIILLAVMISLALYISANNYIKKHSSEIYEKNEPLSSECRDLASFLLKQQSTFKRYLAENGLTQTYNCSNSVLSNAENNPIKYLIKYSDLDYDIQCLEELDFCETFSEKLGIFYEKTDELYKQVSKTIPNRVCIFLPKEKFFVKICNIDLSFFPQSYPVFRFLYISPAGKSQREYKILITTDVIKEIKSELSRKLNKYSHAKVQRNTMTNDLRNAIKKRDNYTCCICGNSIYKEPNLLLEVDHIVPISKGGKTEADNLQTLCWRCNREKSNN